MAEQEKKRAQETLGRVYDFLFELSHNKKLKEYDFKAKSFDWQHDGDPRRICRYQTAEGRINPSGKLALNDKVMSGIRTTLSSSPKQWIGRKRRSLIWQMNQM